jgi:uncharacterized SAM-binding protein YcdF (DUF218 family)
VSIETSPPSVVIKTTKDNQAQIVFVMQHPTVKSINVVLIRLFVLVELMFIISIPLFVDTTTVASSRHVTSKGLPSEQIITLSNVPSCYQDNEGEPGTDCVCYATSNCKINQ